MSFRADALVNGIFEGMDWRESRDDRKRERERQKTQDERTAERHGWDRENHESRKTEVARRRAAEDRQRAAAERERQVFADAYDAAKESYENAPGIKDAPPSPDNVSAAPPMATAPNAPAAPSEMGITDVMPRQDSAVPDRAMVGHMPAPEGVDAPIPEQGRSAISYDQWRGMSRTERERHGLPVSEIGGQWEYRNRHGTFPGAKDVPPPDRGPTPKGAPYANETAPRTPTSERAGPADRGAPAMPAAPKTQEGTPVASAESVQATAPKAPTPGVTGKDMPVKATAAQRKRAETSFLDHYAKVSAPKIIDHYLRTGQIEKAQAFEEFVQSKGAQDGMAGWARAVHAATIGDDDGFADGLADAYNATDYFADGYSVVREDTEFVRDENGNITGARVKLKNNSTGKTFDQIFDGVDDIYRFGVNMLSPEAVFERGLAAVDAADGIQRELDAKRREIAEARTTPEEVMEVIDTLASSNLNFGSLAPSEQIDAALAFLERMRGRALGITPQQGTPQAAPGAANVPTDVPLY